jgi:DNA-binding cell septation regulator SpoVG
MPHERSARLVMVDDRAADTVPVSVTVLRVEHNSGGPRGLLALADVEIAIEGIAFVLHGVRVISTGPRSRCAATPCHRIANGRLADTITLPPELARAVGNAVLDEFDRQAASAGRPIALSPLDALRLRALRR